jgi:hypothetical protein
MLAEEIEQPEQSEEGHERKEASANPDLPRAPLKISVSLEDYVVWYVRHETVLLLTRNRQTARTLVLLIVIAAAAGPLSPSSPSARTGRCRLLRRTRRPAPSRQALARAATAYAGLASRTVICSGSRADGIYNFGSSSCCANVKNASWSGPTWWK